MRATRHLDRQLLTGEDSFFHGHVPVTAMVTLLCAIAAVASGRGGVVMSNEHSASMPNLEWSGLEVNHQWSKSLAAEVLIAEALNERLGDHSRWRVSCARAARSGSPRSSVELPAVSSRLSQLQPGVSPERRAARHLVR